ncbi:hypothetical protein [Streptomyces sp. NPDC003393]
MTSCAAYALAWIEVHGSAGFMTYLLIASSLPSQMFLTPLFFMWAKAGLIYVGLFSPFGTVRCDNYPVGRKDAVVHTFFSFHQGSKVP